MTTDLSLFKSAALVNSEMAERMLGDTKRLAGGSGTTSRRISIKGGRFREIVNGEQLRVNSSGSMNMVIVRMSDINRTYYAGSYDPENPAPPACWSENSKVPSSDVPAETRQAAKCDDCPMNIKGSGQGDARACRFSVRLAVCLEGDYDTVYQLQIPATSLFGDAKDPSKLGLQAYARYMSANQIALPYAITKMRFDENSETPKLFFSPVRPLEGDEMEAINVLYESEEAKRAVTLTVYQADKGSDTVAAAPKAQKKAVVDEEVEEVGEPTVRPGAPSKAAPKKAEEILAGWE